MICALFLLCLVVTLVIHALFVLCLIVTLVIHALFVLCLIFTLVINSITIDANYSAVSRESFARITFPVQGLWAEFSTLLKTVKRY